MSLKDHNVLDTRRPKRVAVVISIRQYPPPTAGPWGFCWSELAHPYYVLSEKGYQIDVFSPDGGKCVGDDMSDPRHPSGYSATDLISMGFFSTPKLFALTQNTRKAAEIDVGRFDGIICAGGQGPIFTYEKATDLQKKFVEFCEAGKIACALCHGTALLRFTRLSNGEYRVKGKAVTGFARVEDYAVDAVWSTNLLPRDKHVTPWRIEDELKKLEANYIQAGLWRGFVTRDGNLITGQQNFSGAETGEAFAAAVGH